ncbi:hypothetical protein BHM03_00033960 [Ensete ventricosum]|nr:hypothetical protein BHM03_00033960 [Ensete ventricosum]
MSSSPPPSSSAIPPSSSTSTPPPPSPPPVSSPPSPFSPSSPPTSPPSVSPPPSIASSPPPVTTPSPPLPSSSPPPSASPQPPRLSPPPASSATSPPASAPSTPPTAPTDPPPSSGSPPPASLTPPSVTPPAGSSPTSPSAKPPNNSPSSPPPSSSVGRPSVTPSKHASSPAESPPSNFSGSTTPKLPDLPPPLPSSVTPPGSIPTPHKRGPNTPSVPGSDVGQGDGGLKTGPAVAIGLVVALVVLSIAGLAVCSLRKRKKSVAGCNAGLVMPSSFTSSIMSDSPLPMSSSAPCVRLLKSGSIETINSQPETAISSTTPWFLYGELYDITNGFTPQNILGEGGFGPVFKGCLADGREVAVKQLKVGSEQGEHEFKAEVEIISRVHHRHLVSLVGYCISDNQRLLVYDYVPNGTLESHLHGKRKPVMDWATRVKVAAGAARGIAYLHEDCHPRIIHRDIKSSNILLDNNFEAQVSDFGLARLAMDACTHVTTRVIGTFGYLDPEYASSGRLTEKSDVFSFGVVLLELITGQKPVDSTRPMGDESLVEWARPLLSRALETGEFGELPDPRLEKNYNEAEMFRMIEAAAACTRHSAAMRPQMGKVVRVFDCLADIDLSNGVRPGQSKVFHVAHSADVRIFQQLVFGRHDSSSEYSQYNWCCQTDM